VLLVLAVTTAQGVPVTQTYGPFDVTFYNNGDTDGYLTGEQNWTPEQRADVGTTIQAWDSYITNVPGRQIRMHVYWNELDSYGTNVLGGSASYRNGDGTSIWNFGEYVWREGLDPGTTVYGFDTVIQYDITAGGSTWNFGADAPTLVEIDFRSVITHEIGHSLGWSSTYDYLYDDWGWLGTSYAGLSEWDKNLVDSLGNKPLSGGTGTPGNFNEEDNPVFWDGSNAVGYHGGNVPIYAPDPYQTGSSLSHLDEDTFQNLLMSPAIANGQMIRSVSGLEWEMMKDMSWTVIPEPATICLLGLGALGLLRKRRA